MKRITIAKLIGIFHINNSSISCFVVVVGGAAAAAAASVRQRVHNVCAKEQFQLK